MIHARRHFQVADVATAEELAHKLTEYTWCPCNGFRLNNYLFLNDSFSPDGAQEYAVFDAGGQQIESVTFGWMTTPEALITIDALIHGRIRSEGLTSSPPQLDHPPESCHLCA